ncbi:MAG: ABC transporter permease, partial [Lachnospiraceae bacterium]|nr:ABC transporter permease [Lachnospiraceae bacterium]
MKLIINDVRQNKLSSASTVFFMAVSAMMLALTTLLFSGLFGAIDSLMDKAAAPDYMQMHAVNQTFARESSVRESETEKISRFAKSRKEVVRWQICGFLNLDNSRVRLGGSSMADSTQDNGLCLQGEGFDYLLDKEGGLPAVSPGEVFVPVCYRSLYHLTEGDIMEIGEERLVIAGFIRDAQMNSMMASSKRFLVHKEDYERIRDAGYKNNIAAEELLIEFLLRDGADSNAFAAAYAAAGLLSDGPAITRPLIRTMNALSEGTMIFVIFLISIVTLLISMLCIRFLCLIQMERERKEVGMLKVLGVGAAEIMRLYIAKYFFFSVLGALAGLSAAFALKEPLEKQVRELYGAAKPELPAGIWAVAAVCLA